LNCKVLDVAVCSRIKKIWNFTTNRKWYYN